MLHKSGFVQENTKTVTFAGLVPAKVTVPMTGAILLGLIQNRCGDLLDRPWLPEYEHYRLSGSGA